MIYKPEFVFIPQSDNTFFGLIGLCVYIFNKTLRNQIIIYSRGYPFPLFKAYIPVLLVALLSISINMTTEILYVKYFISIVFSYFMVYLGMIGFYKIYKEVTPQIIIKYLIFASLIHVIISLLMFVVPTINDLLNSLVKLNEDEIDKLESTFGARLQGFGALFYTSGLINGFVLIMIAISLYLYKTSITQKILYLLSFAVIFIIGIMIARTIMIGGAFAFMILVVSLFKNPRHIARNLITLGIASFLFDILLVKVVETSNADFALLSDFGFEIFKVLFEGGGSTHSTDSMLNMYKILPESEKTWLIGDALWIQNGLYYKEVDIGYLRNIFYFGIIGSAFLYLYNYRCLSIIISKRYVFGSISKKITILLFLYVLILNFKGTIDLYTYILPFYFCTIYPNKKKKILNSQTHN